MLKNKLTKEQKEEIRYDNKCRRERRKEEILQHKWEVENRKLVKREIKLLQFMLKSDLKYYHHGYFEFMIANIQSKIKKNKHIYQYDLEGNLIKKWEDIYDVIKYNYGVSHIASCCNNVIKKAYNYIWSWEYQTFDKDYLKSILPSRSEQLKNNKYNLGRKQSDETKEKKKNKLLGQKRSQDKKNNISNGRLIPIIQYDLEGNFIKEWPSMKEAGLILNTDPSNISACCRGIIKTSSKFKWKYKQ